MHVPKLCKLDNRSQLDPSHQSEKDLRVDHQASCLLHLRGSSAIRWGIRKRVTYLSRKLKEVKPNMSSRVASESESKAEGGGSLKQGKEDSEAGEITMVGVNSHSEVKTKRGDSSGDSKRSSKKIAGRWSVQRCESAKKALLGVVKGMNATWENPVLRHDLRAQSRKHIGDTGLLDHLLRHMAGQVFPDGKERLVRRHNSEGAIQYWLEPAELAGIRREAGISDPYWVPPPGWKLGDAISNHICDEHCNRQINSLKMEISELKQTAWSEIAELKEAVKNQQEEIFLLKEENEKRRKEKLAKMLKETCIGASSKKLVEEKVTAKQVVAGDRVGTMERTARKSAFNICQPEGTFLWPDMGSTGVTNLSPHSVTSATSLPLQPIVLPSPTSPLPPQLPAFFCQQQPDNNRQVYSFSQAQSNVVLVPSPGQGIIRRPTAGYASLPHDMNSEANASNRVECGALTLVKAPAAMNSNKTDVVMTDLTLGSYYY